MEAFAYHFSFGFISSYWGILLKGLWTTITLSACAIVLSTALAVTLGVLMSRKIKAIKYPSIIVVDVVRSTPLLVIILICYYAFPAVGLRTSPFWPALTAITLDTGAFLADVIRGSIEGIPKGQILAAKAMGMNNWTTLRRIVLPEVFRETLPTISLMHIGVIRVSSLASVIAVYELTHTGNWIMASTFKPLEIYLIIGILYVAIILPLMMLSRRFEKSEYFRRRSV